MQLEQILYQTSDLGNLSVLALYTAHIRISPIKAGMMLPGGLEISKKSTKDMTVLKHDYGGIFDIYKIHPSFGIKHQVDKRGKGTIVKGNYNKF